MQKISSDDLPLIPTSHDDDVYKKTIIQNGQIPNLTTFGIGYLNPGQQTTEHIHPTMYEIFYIQKGNAEFVINDQRVIANKADTIVIQPGEKHYQVNNTNSEVEWIYYGIAVE